MSNINSLIKVMPLQDYILELVYHTGERRLLDMKPYLDFGLFRKLHDPVQFNSVRIAFDTIEWEGHIDLDPEFIYEKSVEISG
jgi:hypothetical protein